MFKFFSNIKDDIAAAIDDAWKSELEGKIESLRQRFHRSPLVTDQVGIIKITNRCHKKIREIDDRITARNLRRRREYETDALFIEQ